MKENISLVAGLHGNEQLPVKALEDLGVDFVLGNPLAYEQDVRYTETDLNASFGLEGDSYEINRANQILSLIPEENKVVDFHTTSAETEPFVIIVDKNLIPFAKTFGIKRIVLMSFNVKQGRALINRRNGVSIELGKHDDVKTGYELVQTIVRNLDNSNLLDSYEIYEVYDSIREQGLYKNFSLYQDEFFPILAGETSYVAKGIYGLKARKLIIE